MPELPITMLACALNKVRGRRSPRLRWCRVADAIKGSGPDLHVALKPGLAACTALANEVCASVVTEIGAIARPRRVVIVPVTPKTRSGNAVMSHALAAVSTHQDAGDASTLASREIVDKIRELAK